MRVPRTWVPLMARRIVEDLLSWGIITPRVHVEELISETEKIVLDELMVEDKVNEEVRDMLKKYSADIEKGRLDYRRVFELTKKKVVEERGLIL